jgi:sodium/proline symporter
MSNTTGWIIVAFAFYLLMMVVIGAVFAKRNKSAEDYFLGGRNLGGFVAALSAQASDMSGWLLMGLPGAIYLTGLGGDGWCAIGLFAGTVLNWVFISKRIRRYTIRANNAVTLPEYFQNRFHDDKRILMKIASIIIVVFFLVYTASALAAGGQLFESVFNVDYKIALTIGAIVILAYTFLGGFLAVCTTDFIQGTLMLVALLAVPIFAYVFMKQDGVTVMDGLVASNLPTSDPHDYLNLMKNGTGKNSIINIISGLAWGLGYCGMPHILVRFMAIRNEKELKKSKAVAIIWVAISLTFACFIGILGRAYLKPELLANGNHEHVFIEMIQKVFVSELAWPIIAGVFLCGILAAIMSTADSQLLVSASSVAEDLYKGIFKKEATDQQVMRVSRITVIVVAILAYLIALNPNNTIMGLVSYAWAGLGASFGPLVVLSLFWKRTNVQGAIAGMSAGAIATVLWDYVPMIKSAEGMITLKASTGLYSLAVGFTIGVLVIVVVSLLTPKPSKEMLQEFEDVKKGNVKEI